MPFRIVYIDDEADLLSTFFEIHSRPGVEVLTFTDPQKGLESILAHPPDLVILDYRLPGTTGDAIALKLNPQLPKILISGDLMIQIKAQFLKVFQKPYDDDEIEEIIDKLMAS